MQATHQANAVFALRQVSVDRRVAKALERVLASADESSAESRSAHARRFGLSPALFHVLWQRYRWFGRSASCLRPRVFLEEARSWLERCERSIAELRIAPPPPAQAPAARQSVPTAEVEERARRGVAGLRELLISRQQGGHDRAEFNSACELARVDADELCRSLEDPAASGSCHLPLASSWTQALRLEAAGVLAARLAPLAHPSSSDNTAWTVAQPETVQEVRERLEAVKWALVDFAAAQDPDSDRARRQVELVAALAGLGAGTVQRWAERPLAVDPGRLTQGTVLALPRFEVVVDSLACLLAVAEAETQQESATAAQADERGQPVERRSQGAQAPRSAPRDTSGGWVAPAAAAPARMSNLATGVRLGQEPGTGTAHPSIHRDVVEPAPGPVVAPTPASPPAHPPAPQGSSGGEQRFRDQWGRAWVDRLLGSEFFVHQARSAGRLAPTREELTGLLHALDEANGTLSVKELGRLLRCSSDDIVGMVSCAKRVLNSEARSCLVFDQIRVTLVYEALAQQFGLGAVR
jgi:hypothetical protein